MWLSLNDERILNVKLLIAKVKTLLEHCYLYILKTFVRQQHFVQFN